MTSRSWWRVSAVYKELAGEQPAGVGEHDEGDAELAALGLVHRQAVGQLERVAAFVSEFAAIEPVFGAQLPGELDLELPRHAPEIPCLILPDDDADVAVGEVGLPSGLRPDVAPALVDDIDDLVAVEEHLRADGTRHLATPTLRLGKLPRSARNRRWSIRFSASTPTRPARRGESICPRFRPRGGSRVVAEAVPEEGPRDTPMTGAAQRFLEAQFVVRPGETERLDEFRDELLLKLLRVVPPHEPEASVYSFLSLVQHGVCAQDRAAVR